MKCKLRALANVTVALSPLVEPLHGVLVHAGALGGQVMRGGWDTPKLSFLKSREKAV